MRIKSKHVYFRHQFIIIGFVHQLRLVITFDGRHAHTTELCEFVEFFLYIELRMSISKFTSNINWWRSLIPPPLIPKMSRCLSRTELFASTRLILCKTFLNKINAVVNYFDFVEETFLLLTLFEPTSQPNPQSMWQHRNMDGQESMHDRFIILIDHSDS